MMHELVQKAILERRNLLEPEAMRLLGDYNLPVLSYKYFDFREELNENELFDLKYPVVVKVVSPDIVHKTDYDGVRINITDWRALKQNIEDMKRRIEGKNASAWHSKARYPLDSEWC